MNHRRIDILYATVSGNAEQLAFEAAKRLEGSGRQIAVRDLAGIAAAELSSLQTALFIVSTWGDGEPPPDAARFFRQMSDAATPGMKGLAYAVLALGSSRYPDFCGCGRRLDDDLARLGARRLLPRAECDVKPKATFEQWIAAVAEALRPR